MNHKELRDKYPRIWTLGLETPDSALRREIGGLFDSWCKQIAELTAQLETSDLVREGLEARITELEAKIAKFIDDENHGETYPPGPER